MVRNYNFEEQLQTFFIQWNCLSDIKKPIKSLQKPSIKPNELESFFNEFNVAYEPIHQLNRQGFFVNVWQTAGLKRDEVRNSQVLKWFLDCNADHGFKNRVLDLFLKSLSMKIDTPQQYSTYAENYPINDGLNRIDIEIESNELLIFIEVKIDANEGFEQLKRYQEVASKKSNGKKWAVIYLTTNGLLPRGYVHSEFLVSISWSDFAKSILLFIRNKNLQAHNLWLLKQFAEHIKTF